MSVPSLPCQRLSLPILAYATNLDYASLKYCRSLHKVLLYTQTTGSSHANISTPLKCTITVSHTDCTIAFACIIISLMHSLRLAPNNVYIRLVILYFRVINNYCIHSCQDPMEVSTTFAQRHILLKPQNILKECGANFSWSHIPATHSRLVCLKMSRFTGLTWRASE